MDIVPAPEGTLAARRQTGQEANEASKRIVFAEYLSEKSQRTLYDQRRDLLRFSEFLSGRPGYEDVDPVDFAASLQNGAADWHGITAGIMRAFKAWMTNQGYALGTINRRLVTVKKYASLAFDGGAIDETEHARMRLVKGISLNAGKNLDDNREASGKPTRIGNKKSKHVTITARQADMLRQHPDTP